jgi:glutamate-1-semialdehyde 2,1-aminomutase
MIDQKNIWKKSLKIIPGGNGLLSKRPERFLPDGWPTYFSKSDGAHIWDLNNKKYLDMTSMGIGTSVIGYNNLFVNNYVKKKIDLGVNTTLNCFEEYELAKELLKIDKFAQQVKFARGGGEAMSIAIRLARSKSKKTKILFCGYHGWHDWYLAANLKNIKNLDNHLLKNLKPIGVPNFLKDTAIPLEFNNIEQLKKSSNIKNLAAIVVEPQRLIRLSKDYVKTLNKICKKRNIILIVDEITSGWRDCVGGVYKKIGIEPSIVVYGKAMGNGFAISAIVGKKEIMDIAQDTFVSSVAWTERVGFSAALAVIKFHKNKKVFKHNKQIGIFLKREILRLSKKNNLKIKINELDTIINFDFIHKKSAYIQTLFTELMLKENILANNLIYLSYSHKMSLVRKYLLAVDKTFKKISSSLKNNLNILKSRKRIYNYKRLSPKIR